MSIRVFCPLSNWNFLHVELSITFFQPVYLSLHLFNRVVHKAKIFHFHFHDDENILIVPVIDHAFTVKPKNSSPSPRFQRFSPMFFSESFVFPIQVCESFCINFCVRCGV